MKKLLLLLCGIILCLSACQSKQTQKSAPEKRIPPDRELTMEEALDYATPLYSYELMNEIVEDMDAAKKNCEGYYYLMNLFVATNDPDNDYLRAIAEDPKFTFRSGVQYVLYLPKDERAELETEDIIQVVGKISSLGVSDVLKRRATVVEVSDAHCVATSFEVTGEILAIRSYKDGRRYCSLIDSDVLSSELGEIAVFLPDGFDCVVGDTITATGTLHGSIIYATLVYPETEYLLCMETPEHIEVTAS